MQIRGHNQKVQNNTRTAYFHLVLKFYPLANKLFHMFDTKPTFSIELIEETTVARKIIFVSF